MRCNMGGADRMARAALGLAVAGAGAYLHSWWALAGLVPLGTSAVAWCPMYVPFGLSTRKP